MKLSEIKFFNRNRHIEAAIKRYRIKNATIRADGKVDVASDVHLNENSLTNLSIKFGHVKGYFFITYEKLESLEGCPERVDKDFHCVDCHELKSLQYSPAIVNGDYILENCPKIDSLKGCTENIGGRFDCRSTAITSLEHGPKSVGIGYNVDFCKQLKNLDFLPEKIDGHLSIIDLDSVRYYLDPIFNIKGLKKVFIHPLEVANIVNKYLQSNDMLNCQDELIEAGFEEYADVE